ncbi:MAG: Bax inhibitor-1/YccA family protein [Aureispira sp.]
MKSSNPFIGEEQFANTANKTGLGVSRADGVMTIQGTVNKTMLLAVILIISAVLSAKFIPPSRAVFLGSMFAAVGVAFFTYKKPEIAHILAPIYAVLEGIAMGTFTYMMAYLYAGDPEIITNAIMLTALCLVSMLGAYKFGLIKATKKFRSFIVTATGAIMMMYLVSIGLSFVGITIPYLHTASLFGIGISLFIIGIAVLNLILDFDTIERGAEMGAPKMMEWVSGMGLLITLVWIYFEILKLLAILSGRD